MNVSVPDGLVLIVVGGLFLFALAIPLGLLVLAFEAAREIRSAEKLRDSGTPWTRFHARNLAILTATVAISGVALFLLVRSIFS